MVSYCVDKAGMCANNYNNLILINISPILMVKGTVIAGIAGSKDLKQDDIACELRCMDNPLVNNSIARIPQGNKFQ